MQNYTNSVPQCKKCFRLCVLHPSSFLFVVAKKLCFSQIACFVRELGLTYYLKYGALKSLPFSKTYECQKAKVPSSQKCNALIHSVFFSKQKIIQKVCAETKCKSKQWYLMPWYCLLFPRGINHEQVNNVVMV